MGKAKKNAPHYARNTSTSPGSPGDDASEITPTTNTAGTVPPTIADVTRTTLEQMLPVR